MNKIVFTLLLFFMANFVFADQDLIDEQRAFFDSMTPENAKRKRLDILKMADTTLDRLYKVHPRAREEIQSAYGYGVFEGQAVNMIVYVAGKGLGVVFDNKTKKPIFMNAIRAGTGPGVGYKSLHGVIIFENELVYNQFTTVGLHIGASADASFKVSGKGIENSKSFSLVPGVTVYQLNNTGIVLQANWGATEFLKDPNLN